MKFFGCIHDFTRNTGMVEKKFYTIEEHAEPLNIYNTFVLSILSGHFKLLLHLIQHLLHTTNLKKNRVKITLV